MDSQEITTFILGTEEIKCLCGVGLYLCLKLFKISIIAEFANTALYNIDPMCIIIEANTPTTHAAPLLHLLFYSYYKQNYYECNYY